MDKDIENRLKKYVNSYGIKFTEKSVRYLEERRGVTLDGLKKLPIVKQCCVLAEAGLLHEFPKHGEYVKTIANEFYFGWVGIKDEIVGMHPGFDDKFNNGEYLRDFMLNLLEENKYNLDESWGA